MFALFLNKEDLCFVVGRYLRDGVFTGVIMTGSVLTTVFAPHQGNAQTDGQIFDVYLSKTFAWCVFGLAPAQH